MRDPRKCAIFTALLLSAAGCGRVRASVSDTLDGGVELPTGAGGFAGTNPGAGGSGGSAGVAGGACALACNRSIDGDCTQDHSSGPLKRPEIQLVVSIDESMNRSVTEPAGGASKWDFTRAALKAATSHMPTALSLGVSFYPNTPGGRDGTCIRNNIVVPIEIMDGGHKALIATALDLVVPEGGLPAADAFEFGLGTVRMAMARNGAPYVVLLLDGAPSYARNCAGDGVSPVDNGALIEAIRGASVSGVRTFVVGLRGSENVREDLSSMALAGGTARAGCSGVYPDYCHFDTTVGADITAALTQALDEITGHTLGCVYTLPEPPAGSSGTGDRVSVSYTPGGSQTAEPIPWEGPGARCETGWQLTEDKKHVLLCGPSCARVRADAWAKVELGFSCRSGDETPW